MQTHSGSCSQDTIRPECSVDCLKQVLSRISFNTLARAYDAPFDPPATVESVVDLYLQGRLDEIWGLGPRRIGEIETALVFAGLISADGQLCKHRRSMKQSTGVAREDGLSVSIHMRMAAEAEKEPDLLVVEVKIPIETLNEFLQPAAIDQHR
jgi:hypothetical protein